VRINIDRRTQVARFIHIQEITSIGRISIGFSERRKRKRMKDVVRTMSPVCLESLNLLVRIANVTRIQKN